LFYNPAEIKSKMTHQYHNQRTAAIRRGTAMELTLNEWRAIWWDSGKWHERGTGTDNYQMCRRNDQGSYAMGNVRIDTMFNNQQDLKERRKIQNQAQAKKSRMEGKAFRWSTTKSNADNCH
jgi:hypothetical protein